MLCRRKKSESTVWSYKYGGEITKRLNLSPSLVSVVKFQMRKRGLLPKSERKGVKKVKKAKTKPSIFGSAIAKPEGSKAFVAPKVDLVNNPPHYTQGGIEVIDFIEAKRLGYNLGNVVKYVSRVDDKDEPLENLRKAEWYLKREIARRESVLPSLLRKQAN